MLPRAFLALVTPLVVLLLAPAAPAATEVASLGGVEATLSHDAIRVYEIRNLRVGITRDGVPAYAPSPARSLGQASIRVALSDRVAAAL